jgi:ATP-dependent DNA helicase RecG
MRYRESETLELKKSTSEVREAVVSIAAILNKHSQGKLLFGIRANGEVIGQDVSEQTIRDVSRAISENIEPRIYPKVQRLKLSGKTCIRVEFSGNDSPYLAYGRAYIRVGDEDKQASAREMERMFLNRNKEAFRWESEPSTRKLSDIDERAVKMFIKKSNLMESYSKRLKCCSVAKTRWKFRLPYLPARTSEHSWTSNN